MLFHLQAGYVLRIPDAWIGKQQVTHEANDGGR